jgi:hypothetical protein
VQGRGYLGYRSPPIGSEQRDEALVESIGDMHAYIMHHLAMQIASYADDFYNFLALCSTSDSRTMVTSPCRTPRKEPQL